MTRILKLGLLYWIQKTNGLFGLTINNKKDIMYSILSSNYDTPKDVSPYGKSKMNETCNYKSGKVIQRIA
jgi:hypothetical protein